MNMNTKRSVNALLLIFFAASTTQSLAAVKNWNTTGGNLNSGGNWSPVGVPIGGDDVSIQFTDGVDRTVIYGYSGPAITLNSLTLGLTNHGGANTSTLSMAANSLSATTEIIGTSGGATTGAGTFAQSGGTNLNGIVDAADAGILFANWGISGGALFEDADFNGDGIIDAQDFGMQSGTWGVDLQDVWVLSDLDGDSDVDVNDLDVIFANLDMTGATWEDGDLNGD